MNKKNITYLVAFLCLFFLFIVVSWQFVKNDGGEEYISEMWFLDSNAFVFENQVLLVEKMSIEIPEEWEKEREEKRMSFYSSDLGYKDNPCKIGVQFGKVKEKEGNVPTIAEYINTMIDNSAYEGLKEPGVITHEAFFLTGGRGLKTIFNLEENITYTILEIPDNDTIYIIESGLIASLECRDKFEEALNTISINYEEGNSQ